MSAQEEVEILINAANVRSSHIYITSARHLIPDDAVGPANSRDGSGRPVRVTFIPGPTIETDIPNDKNFLRDRSSVRRFFEEANVKPGDRVVLSRLGNREFQIKKKSIGSAANPEIASAAEVRKTGQAYRQSAAERRAIELHAMQIAGAYLRENGFQVEDTSSNRPYDFLASKGGRGIIVEVKGTVSEGDEILLTGPEVDAHREHSPNNALLVVSSIELDVRGEAPVCRGGQLNAIFGWKIVDTDLKVLQYKCRVSFE